MDFSMDRRVTSSGNQWASVWDFCSPLFNLFRKKIMQDTTRDFHTSISIVLKREIR
ncbi:hypothetical protein DPMN_133156 [Dreissena polymorpha]|uniref:Uncharacterized protein n=1 Tax=Dreissena polymorpha TaxID=45954 RepID=A0A9D4FT01_DREPO|nr:hypothetical protein DPMN_133156 [Dreissena polymorpha]